MSLKNENSSELRVWHESIIFGAEESLVSPIWRDEIDRDRLRLVDLVVS